MQDCLSGNLHHRRSMATNLNFKLNLVEYFRHYKRFKVNFNRSKTTLTVIGLFFLEAKGDELEGLPEEGRFEDLLRFFPDAILKYLSQNFAQETQTTLSWVAFGFPNRGKEERLDWTLKLSLKMADHNNYERRHRFATTY